METTTNPNPENARNLRMLAAFQNQQKEAANKAKSICYALTRSANMTPIVMTNDLGEDVVGINLDAEDGIQSLIMTKIASNQMAALTGIPPTYYDQLQKSDPELLTRCVASGLRSPETRSSGSLLCLNGESMESLLSDRYVVLTNDQVFALATQLKSEYNLEPDVCHLADDQTLTINLLSKEKDMTLDLSPDDKDLKVRDIMRFGIRLKNNPAGLGAFTMQLVTVRLVCLNGMSIPNVEEDLKIRHHGSPYDIPMDKARRLVASEVKCINDEELIERGMGGVGKLITITNVQKMRRRIERSKKLFFNVRNPLLLMQAIVSRMGISIPAQILAGFSERLIRESSHGQISAWDFANVITRQAQEITDVSLRTLLEEKSQKILSFSGDDINAIQHLAYADMEVEKLAS